MSYDIDLMIDTGTELRRIVEIGNHTSNTAPMWTKALGTPLRELNGRNAGECVELLERGVKDMEEHEDEYTPLNPPNGWGNYGSALKYLRKLLKECRENPKCVIDMSY